MTKARNFRPYLNKDEVQIIINALLDRLQYNAPDPSSSERGTIDKLVFQFESMEERSNYLVGRRKTRRGAKTK